MTRFPVRAIVVASLLVFLPQQRASAHATPTLYEPAAGAALERAPARIQIRFSERIEEDASAIEVFAPDATHAESGNATVDPADKHLFVVPVVIGTEGTFVVSWQVVSADDGHFTKGAYTFSIGRADASGSEPVQAIFAVEHRTSVPEALAIALELLGFAGMLGFLLLSLFLQRLPAERRGFLMSAVLTAAGLLFYVFLQTYTLAVNRQQPFAEALSVFLRTVSGSFALWRALVLCVIIVSFLLRRRALSVILLILYAVLRARVSHAAASEFLPAVSVVVNAVHLVAKSAWIGLLGAFLVLLGGLRSAQSAGMVARAHARLAGVLSILFGVGALTGAYIVWLHLKAPANIAITHWGMYFLNLTGAAALLFILRLYHQLAVVPAGVQVSGGSADDRGREIFRGAWMPLLLEFLAGVTVLFVSSVLIITTPPDRARGFAAAAVSEGVRINLAEHPYEDDALLLTFVGRRTKMPQKIEEATVTLRNETEHIGPIVAPTVRRFTGAYVFPRSLLSPPGAWMIEVTGRQPPAYDAVAGFGINIPADLRIARAARAMDAFAITAIFVAILASGASLLLFLHARRAERAVPAAGTAPIDLTLIGSSFLTALAVGTVFFLLLGWQFSSHGHGGFKPFCERTGGRWTENVPMRAGRPLMSTAVLGCSVELPAGPAHFGHVLEYAHAIGR